MSNTASRSEPGPLKQVKEIETEQLLKSAVSMKYPSDHGLYVNTICDKKIKKLIIECGSCWPSGPFKTDDTSNYSYKTKGGLVPTFAILSI